MSMYQISSTEFIILGARSQGKHLPAAVPVQQLRQRQAGWQMDLAGGAWRLALLESVEEFLVARLG